MQGLEVMNHPFYLQSSPAKIQNQTQLLIGGLQVRNKLVAINRNNFGASFDFQNNLTIYK
jgi:hypothetical protein